MQKKWKNAQIFVCETRQSVFASDSRYTKPNRTVSVAF